MKIKDLLDNKNIDKNQNKLALGQVLNLSIPEIMLNKERELNKKEQKKYNKIKNKLEKNIPIQYILKESMFYGNKFYINENVLIPRPETERLIELTHDIITKEFKKDIKVLDIGTGSGVIAITLDKLLKNSEIVATDISNKALKVAKRNQRLNNTHVKFIKTNLYQGINDKFDVIISNPPYIDPNSNNIEKIVKENEPKIALFAKNGGLYYYSEILKGAKSIINTKHVIAFEIGEEQSKDIKNMIKEYLPEDKIIVKKDYNKYDRYIFALGGIKNE